LSALVSGLNTGIKRKLANTPELKDERNARAVCVPL
jgi:hypothetical protein